MKLANSAFSVAVLAVITFSAVGKCADGRGGLKPGATGSRGWEGTIDLPTYALGDEDPSPPFPLVNHHQIYPYTMLDDLTDHRETKTYRAIYLENEHLKATILPDFGGRLYSLFDKVSKREVFYRNNVVKYGLVSLRGAWISGGIEFNFPNGHTVATVSPVASRLLTNPDGSATAIVGGIDWVTEMHWKVALTLRRQQARLEQHVTLFNSTPLENLYWYWANAAVPATQDMQFIYPMREANPHSHTEIWTYPDWDGVDYSWYKNIRQPTSLFGREIHRNFFGAYYHDSDYGVVHVADFREVPGKKIWSWGMAGDGLIWTDLLTDKDGAYNEIQSGRYETQLNQEFMPPHRIESWTEYWYPVRGLGGGFVEATRELALNANFVPASDATPQHIELAVDPTVDIQGAKIRIMLGETLLREFGPITFNATTTAKFNVPAENLEAAKKSLSVEIEGADSGRLLYWTAAGPIDGNKDLVPSAGVHVWAEKPLEKMTVEESYLRGVDEEKNGGAEAAARIYEQLLQRDPMYIPALLKLAMRDYSAANLDAAEAKIVLAEKRNKNDPAVQYTAGLIYRTEGNLARAQDAFWSSLQFGGTPAPAFTQLGEISIQQKNYGEAIKLLRQALSYNPEDALMLTDIAVALRLSGNPTGANTATDRALDLMPLLPLALVEKWVTQPALGMAGLSNIVYAKLWKKVLGFDAQNYLLVAAWYRTLGDLSSADAVLAEALKDFPPATISPMVYYYLAANARQEGHDGRASELAASAMAANPAKIFPQRLSDALVLADAISHNPKDSYAHYFLGTFLFAHGRFEVAAKHWLAAKDKGFEDPVLERNLGVYAWRVKKDLAQAANYYEKAIQLAPSNYRLYTDLDEIYTQSGNHSRREKLFTTAPAGVQDQDTFRARRALFLVEQRQFDQAMELLNDHHFKPWEGGQIIREIFVLANLEKGRHALETKQYAEAERVFRHALEYPVNLGVGKPDKTHDEEAWYWLGTTFAAEGNASGAQQALQTAVKEGNAAGGVSGVFAAGALIRLGQVAEGKKQLAAASAAANQPDPSGRSLYVAGLAENLQNHEQAAQMDYHRAVELDPLLWEARIELNRNTTPHK